MASFRNPKPAAAEKLPPMPKDPEAGEAGIKSSQETSVSVSPPPFDPKNAMSQFVRTTGITDPKKLSQGGKKSRKHKKRAHKKTQKRRGRK